MVFRIACCSWAESGSGKKHTSEDGGLDRKGLDPQTQFSRLLAEREGSQVRRLEGISSADGATCAHVAGLWVNPAEGQSDAMQLPHHVVFFGCLIRQL